MAQKNSMPLDKFKILCDFDGEKYVSKRGADYIAALAQVFSLVNENDKPFTLSQIRQQPLINDFDFEGVKEFKYICDLEASPLVISGNERKNEKIVATNFQVGGEAVFLRALGVTYLLTAVVEGYEHIIKIGSSRTTFKSRLGSYNCGTVNAWRTASTTNIKILQSFVTTRATYKLYLYDCSADQYKINWHGEDSVPFASPKALAVEDILVKKFQSIFGKKPLANIQVSATQVKEEES